MTLTEKTELVLEVLRGAEIPELARAEQVPPRTLKRWVREFLRAGIAALWRQESEPAGPLATITPLFPVADPRAGRRPGARRRR